MRLLRFDRAERLIDRYQSVAAHAGRISTSAGPTHLTCLTIGPGGTIGTHPAPFDQLFLVIAGEGWVSGPDGARIPVTAGTAVHWSPGEEHASGTDTHLTALALEGPGLDLFEPEHP